MHASRLTRNRSPRILIAALIVLLVPATMRSHARAEVAPTGRDGETTPSEPTRQEALVVDPDRDDVDSDRPLRGTIGKLVILNVVLGRSPFTTGTPPTPKKIPPPTMLVPLVVKPPSPPVDTLKTPPGNPPGNENAPEPASIVSGIIGSSLALAALWRRRRRRRPATVRETDTPETVAS